jgi:hypothetical protein
MSASGGAGGAVSKGESSQLEHCSEALGTLAIDEDTSSDWWQYYVRNYSQLGSTVPALRMIVQQSN